MIRLHLRRTEAHFSEEEREYFFAAAIEGRISQTHYTHPDVQMCYRCPLRDKVLNPVGLGRHTTRHFPAQHNVPNREYIVTLNEEANKKVTINL